MLERDLAEAELHIVRAENKVARQRELIANLRRGAHDSAVAETVLGELLRLQGRLVENCIWIRETLKDHSKVL